MLRKAKQDRPFFSLIGWFEEDCHLSLQGSSHLPGIRGGISLKREKNPKNPPPQGFLPTSSFPCRSCKSLISPSHTHWLSSLNTAANQLGNTRYKSSHLLKSRSDARITDHVSNNPGLGWFRRGKKNLARPSHPRSKGQGFTFCSAPLRFKLSSPLILLEKKKKSLLSFPPYLVFP